MQEAGELIFVIGLFAALGGLGGTLVLKHPSGIIFGGTAGFVMIVLGALMMFAC